jgi:hypothetical protein
VCYSSLTGMSREEAKSSRKVLKQVRSRGYATGKRIVTKPVRRSDRFPGGAGAVSLHPPAREEELE